MSSGFLGGVMPFPEQIFLRNEPQGAPVLIKQMKNTNSKLWGNLTVCMLMVQLSAQCLWSLLSLRKTNVQQYVVVLLGRCRLLCEARPILDLHARPHTVHMCSREDRGREVLAFHRVRLSCNSATLISSDVWTAL